MHEAMRDPAETYRELLVCKNSRRRANQKVILALEMRDIPSLSLWKFFKNCNSLSLLRRSMPSICGGFFGLATNT